MAAYNELQKAKKMKLVISKNDVILAVNDLGDFNPDDLQYICVGDNDKKLMPDDFDGATGANVSVAGGIFSKIMTAVTGG